MEMTYAKYELIMKKTEVQESLFNYNLGTSDDAYKFAVDIMRLHEKPHEVFCIVVLDAKGEVIGYSEIARGGLTETYVSPATVYKPALIQNGAAIIAFHCHPSGNATPSSEDLQVTKRLSEAGRLLGIQLFDHIIVGDGEYTSLAKEGLMDG